MRVVLSPVAPTDTARRRRVNRALDRLARRVHRTTSFLVTPKPLVRISKAQAVRFADAFAARNIPNAYIDLEVLRAPGLHPFAETFFWLDWTQVHRDESGILHEVCN
jgi:hypothetical protein